MQLVAIFHQKTRSKLDSHNALRLDPKQWGDWHISSQYVWLIFRSRKFFSINIWIAGLEIFKFLALISSTHFLILENVLKEIKHGYLNAGDLFSFIYLAWYSFAKRNRVRIFTCLYSLTYEWLINLNWIRKEISILSTKTFDGKNLLFPRLLFEETLAVSKFHHNFP